MAKVTSKLQVTLPKKIAEEHGINPGDQIEFESAPDLIRIRPKQSVGGAGTKGMSRSERLRLFEQATKRQVVREQSMPVKTTEGGAPEREWTREALYDRVRTD